MTSGKKVCLLTGAGGRLGETFCRMFGAHYDIIAVMGRQMPKVATQHQWWIDPLAPTTPLRENQGSVYAVRADLNNEADRRRVVDVALARFDRVDAVVNAASIAVTSPMLDGRRLLDEAVGQFETNVLLPLRLATVLAESFWKGRERENRQMNRSVVNVSSTTGLYVYPGLGQSLYSASKAALNYLSMHMGDEFQTLGIRVNALAPTSFPEVISTESVAEGVRRLLESDSNGRVLVLEDSGERWI